MMKKIGYDSDDKGPKHPKGNVYDDSKSEGHCGQYPHDHPDSPFCDHSKGHGNKGKNGGGRAHEGY